MGPFAAYSIKVAILLVAGYLIYKWLMASEKQIAFNRRAIMTIYAASFAMTPVGALWAVIASPGAGATSGVDATALIAGSLAPAQAPLWPAVLVGLYAGGMAVTAIWTVVTLLRLRSIIRSGRHTACRGYTLVILPGREVAPFSWGRYVVMGIDDYRSAGRMITAHELAHIRHRHCLDLMVAQAVCIVQWFNPAAWLLREELKSVHEYQADDSVISYGADARQYQLLLIKKAVGIRFQSIANSLNHSNLKKRITMMYDQTTSGRRRLRGVALVPALALALAVTDLPAVASVLSHTSAASLRGLAAAPAETVSKVTQKAATVQAPAVQEEPVEPAATAPSGTEATFPGGLPALFDFLAKNISYPKSLIESGAKGRVEVHFIVTADGTPTDFKITKSLTPDADAEVLRVCRLMPKWKPAVADGKPASSDFTLPVDFRPQPSSSKSDKK